MEDMKSISTSDPWAMFRGEKTSRNVPRSAVLFPQILPRRKYKRKINRLLAKITDNRA